MRARSKPVPRRNRRGKNSPKSLRTPPSAYAVGSNPGCLRLQCLKQALGKAGRIENRAQQEERPPGVFLARRFDQDLAPLRAAGEALRALQKPNVQLAFRG